MSSNQKSSAAPGLLRPGDLLLGIDPGQTTGLCLAEYSGRIDIQPLMSLAWGWEDWTDMIYLLRATRPRAVICENFIIYKHKAESLGGSDVPSAQVIGALKGWNAHPLTRFTDCLVFPMASEIQNYEVLEQHRRFVGGSEHRKDSYKHVRRFVAKAILRP